VLAHQLDKNLQGRLTWMAGVQSSVNATLIWDREQHHVVTSIQVHVHSVVNWLLCLPSIFDTLVRTSGICNNNNNNCFTALCPWLLKWAGTRRNITHLLLSWSTILYQLPPSTM